MRIHRLRLTDFRGITHAELDFAVPGITIVEGDNEVGKSSVPEGLHLLFEYLDSSRAAAVKSVQPVGRDVGAAVEAEISCGPYHFTYRKRWHRDTETVLSFTRPTEPALVGREAHERVRAILDEVLDTDLFSALQLTQGSGVALPRFATPSLGRALDLAAGAPLHDEHDALLDRVEAERLRYWTPSGQPRKERTAAREDLAEARRDLDEATRALTELDDDIAAVERLEADQRRLLPRRVALQRSRDELVGRMRQAEVARDRVQHLHTSAELAAAEVRSATATVDHRRQLRTRLDHSVTQLETARAATAGLSRRLDDARHSRHRLAAQLEDLHRQVDRSTDAAQQAAAVVDHLRAKHDLHHLDERLTRAHAASERCAESERRLASIRVDRDVVDHLDALTVDLAAAEAAANVGAVTVTATALSGVSLVVDGTDHRLTSGDVHELSTLDPTDITVPGVVTLRVAPGSQGEATRHRVDGLRRELAHACREAGVADLAEARQALSVRDRAEHDLHLARVELTSALGDASIDALERQRQILGEVTSGAAPEGTDATDLDAAVAALESARRHQSSELLARDAARSDSEQALQVVHGLEVELATATAQTDLAADEVDRGRAEVAELADEADDQTLAAILEEAIAAHEAALAAHATASAELGAHHPDDLARLLDTATESVERNETSIERNADELTRLRASLEVRGEHGLHETVNAAATRVAHLERHVEATERRADAAALLAATMHRHRSASRQRHVAPFTDRINRLGRVVFGPDLHIDLDDDLSPGHRTLDGVRLPIDQLSVGAREQIGVIARLACASLVSEHGGAPVILDDALGWSDPARLASMGAAIGLAGDDAQVIILTCTPDRYATAGSAHVVTLQRSASPSAPT